MPEYDRLGIVRGPGRHGAEGHRAVEHLQVARRQVDGDRGERRTTSSGGSARRWASPSSPTTRAFATHLARGENQEEIEGIIAEWAARHDAAEIDRVLNDAGVICGPIYTIADIFEDEQFRARDMLVEHEDPEFGEYVGPGIVPKFSETPGEVRWSATWEEGSHNREVYGGLLGLSDEELDEPRGGGRAVTRDDLRRRSAGRAPERRRRSSTPETRAELVNRLAAAGLPRIEAVSFVNPARVPQMAGAEEVVAAIERRDGVVYAGLVAERAGLRPAARPPGSTRCTSPSPRPRRSTGATRTPRVDGVGRRRRADRRARRTRTASARR